MTKPYSKELPLRHIYDSNLSSNQKMLMTLLLIEENPDLYDLSTLAKRSRFAVFITEKENHLNIRNEIKAQIIRAGFTMQDVVEQLADQYGWSDSVSNLSAKLQRETIRGEGLFCRSIAVHRTASVKRNDYLCRGTHG